MNDELTLPTAMAISGTAASPWLGGRSGVTWNPFISALMALVGLRLGFWVPNPRHTSKARLFRPNHFRPGLIELLGLNLREDSETCLLNDGGQFESLALYELVRRRLKLIVLCDGAADPGYKLANLHNVLMRIQRDFGVRIEFQGRKLGDLVPSVDAEYPTGVRFSKNSHVVAKITYSDGSTGQLVYLKAVLVKDLPFDLLAYKAANQDFPDRSTSNQFLDEEQFEAYRELGYAIADGIAPKIKLMLDRTIPTSARALAVP